jgi:hypothetical protein
MPTTIYDAEFAEREQFLANKLQVRLERKDSGQQDVLMVFWWCSGGVMLVL